MREDWKYLPLGDIVEIKRGLTYSKNDEVETSEKIVLRSNNINLDNHQFDFTELKYLKPSFDITADKYLQKGDLLMCMSNGSKAHLGKVALYEGDSNRYAFGGFMAALSHKDSVIGKYLFYAMTTPMYKEYIKALSDGANINNLKVRDIEAFTIPVPPLAEQERIVALLDDQFAKIDQLKANADLQLRAAKDLFQSALKEIFISGKDWKYCTFADTYPIIMGRTPARADNSLWDKKKVSHNLWVSISDISNNEGGYIYDTEEYVSDLATPKMRKVPKGSLLMSFKLTIGKMAFAGDDLYTNEAIIAIPEKRKYNLRFLYYYLSGYEWSTLTDGAEKVKGKTLNKASIGRILLPEIPLAEQERIAARLDEISEKVKVLQANYDQTITLCNDLKQSLLKSIFA